MKYKYAFCQLRSPRDPRRFMAYEDAVKLIPIDLQLDYYTADGGSVEAPTPEQACEALFRAYTDPARRPEGYSGRNMTVADVVTLWDFSEYPPLRTDWYCDDVGFRRLEAQA